jgi:type I restriction enzyme M protein
LFLLNRGELDERLDVGFYKALQNPDYMKLKQSKYPVFKLGTLSTFITKGETPLWRGDGYIAEGIPFLRGKDIKHGEITFKDIVYISPDVHKRMLRSQLNEDYFLLTMAGTLGDVAYFKSNYSESNINQDIAKIKLTEAISYEYAVSFFSTQLALSQIKILSNGGTRSHLNFSQIRKFKVIVPPKDIQRKIVKYQEEINQIKKQKEAEAVALLASIDGYLLQELGITLPPPSKKKTFFYTPANKVSGGRFDPSFYESKTQEWIVALNNSIYPIKKLKEMSKAIFQGVSQNLTDDNLITLLKVKNISENNIIDFENIEFVKYAPIQKILQEGDIITPFIGEAIRKIKFSVFPSTEKQYTVDNNTGVIRLNDNILPDYVASFLSTKAGVWQIERLIGGGVPFIGSNNAGKLIIPLPPPEKQTEIANHISALRTQAKQLQQQAAAELEQAKQQVEKLILGE